MRFGIAFFKIKMSLHVRFRIKLSLFIEHFLCHQHKALSNAKLDSRVNEPLRLIHTLAKIELSYWVLKKRKNIFLSLKTLKLSASVNTTLYSVIYSPWLQKMCLKKTTLAEMIVTMLVSTLALIPWAV